MNLSSFLRKKGYFTKVHILSGCSFLCPTKMSIFLNVSLKKGFIFVKTSQMLTHKDKEIHLFHPFIGS